MNDLRAESNNESSFEKRFFMICFHMVIIGVNNSSYCEIIILLID